MLVAADEGGVAFRWKDYRLDGPDRWKTMTLQPDEFIRRFLMHVEEVTEQASCDDQRQLPCPCPRCGGHMIIIETFAAGMQPTSWPVPTQIRIDTS